MLSHYAVFPGILPVWKRVNFFRHLDSVPATPSYRATGRVLFLIGVTKRWFRRRMNGASDARGKDTTGGQEGKDAKACSRLCFPRL